VSKYDILNDEDLRKLKELSNEEVSEFINQISVEDLSDLMNLLNGGEGNA
jgi:predicted house-cleaning noncanonical NTP pyrophosphatase (MazG superfamily)